ncbi:MAG: glycosyltransferase family 2 protein [Clostridia bacterium]|nr:glycosyltransferase family 2 protein [Clostridia bacterium]
MKNVLISMVVPIYKVEEYLDRCINSIVNQTYKNLEIILVDDGSPDNCPKMCDDWAKKDSRIKVIHKQNGGLMAAWIDGLKVSTGDYVYFVDSDDYLELDSVSDYVEVIKNHKPDAILNQHYVTYDNKRELGKSLTYNKSGFLQNEDFDEFIKAYLSNKTFFSYYRWNKLFKRQILLNNIKFCNTKISVFEDINIIFATMLDIKNVYILNKPSYNYYVRQSSMIRSAFKPSYVENNDNVLKALINIAKSKKINCEELICHNIYFFSIWCAELIGCQKHNKKQNYDLLVNSFVLNNEYVETTKKYLSKIKIKVFDSLINKKYHTFEFLRFLAKIKHKVLRK